MQIQMRLYEENVNKTLIKDIDRTSEKWSYFDSRVFVLPLVKQILKEIIQIWKTKYSVLAEAAVIGAIYVVLTLLFAPLSYGEIQIRFSEALTVSAILFIAGCDSGLFVGCIIANLFGDLPFL